MPDETLAQLSGKCDLPLAESSIGPSAARDVAHEIAAQTSLSARGTYPPGLRMARGFALLKLEQTTGPAHLATTAAKSLFMTCFAASHSSIARFSDSIAATSSR